MKLLDMEVPAIGLGCWAIGGQFMDLGAPCGWGDVKDENSLEALEKGISMGVKIIDTANIYGAGHSEELVGKVIQNRRNDLFVVTKFGILMDEKLKTTTGIIETADDIRESVKGSLRRMKTDYIDLLLFHCSDYPMDKAPMVKDTLEGMVKDGWIRSYGWSTPDPERAGFFADEKNCCALEFAENVMEDDPVMMSLCREKQVKAICRSPLAMGLLTGKYKKGQELPAGDLRGKNGQPWMTYYIDGKPNEILLAKLEAIREILTTDSRTLAQGCIAYIWAKGKDFAIPIPGFKTAKQVEDNVSALEHGPLTDAQAEEIDRILAGM